MGRYVRSARAQEDLAEIWTFIARDNPEAATRVIRAAYATFETLSQNPELGTMRRRHRELRAFPVSGFRTYVVWYQIIDGGIEIVRVLHGARNTDELFDE